MTSPPPSPNPLADPSVDADLVPLAVRALGTQFATAITCLAVVTWGTVRLAGGVTAATPAQVDPGAAYVNLLLFGTVSTLPLTGLVGWRLMAPIVNSWRRLGVTMVGVLGGLVLGMLATFAAREAAGAPALLGLAMIAAVLALRLAGAARRAVPSREAP